MKFAVDLSKGILGSEDPVNIWTDIIGYIPDSILLKPNVRILVVACGHCTEAVIIAKRMIALGISKEQVCDSIWLIDKYNVFTNHAKLVYGFRHVITEDFLEWNPDMKFDAIVGNPPYQDGTKKGQQNKIYNQMSKKALELLTPTGVMAFITPSSVCKKSKRFSIIENKNLTSVNFTPNLHFNVGVNICYWIIDKSKESTTCSVTSINGTVVDYPRGSIIYDHGVYDELIMKIKTAIKGFSSNPDTRMFLRNNPGPTKSDTKIKKFVYPLYQNNQTDITCYVKRKPYNFGKTKLVLSMTKALKSEMIIISNKDFDDSHVAVCVENEAQIENIKSFIFSDYFINLSNQWKLIDGYGFNESLKYLPMFDKDVKWNNDSVKEFIESFINK